MQPATQLQFTSQPSPNGQCFLLPQSTPSLQDKVGRPTPQPQHEPHQSKEHLPPPPAQDRTAASPPHRIPRLRKVVESQAFKNILVDEMDMMLSRAATLIQANWRGYQLRQKLSSQMMAAKAIQEAWRRFNTKRILRSSKAAVKKVTTEEGDIPYHPPQQVRFQHLEGSQARPKQPIMVSKETQFPSSDSLATCAPQMSHVCTTPSQHAPELVPRAPGDAGVAFLPHQTVAIRFPCPMSLNSKYQPCLLTETIQSACLIRHMEGDALKARHVMARDGKPAPCPRYGQTAATPAHMDTEIFKVTPTPCPCSTSMATRPPPKIYPTCVATTKALGKNYAVPTMTVVKPLPQPCPAPTLTKAQVRPTASLTSNPPPTRPAGLMAKIPPQVCLLASMLKSPPQARPPAATKVPPHAYPVPVVPKSSPHVRLATAPAKSPLQPPCHMTAVPKTPSQTCPSGSSVAKPQPQTRLAAMINKTPAQIRSVAAVLKTLCMTTPAVAASNLKTTPQAGTAAGFPGTTSHIHLSLPKTKVTVNVKQTAGASKLSLHSCLAESKNKAAGRPPHPEATAPKTALPASEKVKVCPAQRHMKTETVVSKTNVAVDMTRPTSWTKVAEARSKPPPVQTHTNAEIVKVQSQVYVPTEVAMTLPQPQLAIPLTKEALSQTHLTSRQSKAGSQVHMAASLTKASSQAQLTTCLSKTMSQTRQPPEPAGVLPEAQLASCPPATQPQAPLGTCPSKAAPPRVHPLAEQTKILSQGRLATCLVRSSPPIYTPSKLAKALSQAHLTSCTCPTKVSSQVHASTQQVQAVSQAPLTAKPSTQTHPPPELTVVLPQTHLMATCAPASISHTQLSPSAAKTPSQIHPPTKLLAKTASLAHLITCLSKAQPQAHLPLNLTKAQSHAQLASEASKGMFAAHQFTDLSAKTQSQPVLAQSKASTPPCHHLSTLPRAKPDDRLTTLQGKATQGPPPPQRQVAADAPGMLVPLLAPSGHMPCNMESWGDSATARTLPPPPSSQVVPCQDDLAASQIASLCAELASVLGSQEDLRALLTKALAQGEVRAALNQALSKEVLGATVAKTLPQGMLGMALMKALSWGELGIALSRALARGELRTEHTKAVQGRLAEVLSKALTEEERAALSQALCQGELGAVLSQSLSQAALRLPKGASKTAATAAAVEADFRGTPSASWAPTLGLVRPQPSKVRVSWIGAWGDFPVGGHAGLWEAMGDGPAVGGLLCCLPRASMGVVYRPCCPVAWGARRRRDFSASLFVRLKTRREAVMCPISNCHPMAGGGDGQGPHVRSPPHLQPWQPLIANGVGPSINQPSVTYGNAPSSHKPNVVSKGAARLWTSGREGRVASGKLLSGDGRGRAPHAYLSSPACRGTACWCQSPGSSRIASNLFPHPLGVGSPHKPSRGLEGNLGRLASPNTKQVSGSVREMLTKMTPGPLKAAITSRVQVCKSQVDCGLFQATSGSRLVPILTQTPPTTAAAIITTGTDTAGAGSSLVRGPKPAAPAPRELVAGRPISILGELVTSRPPPPPRLEPSLTKGIPQAAMGYSAIESNSQSSLQSYSSLSLSTVSMASLTTIELVEASWEGHAEEELPLDALLPKQPGATASVAGEAQRQEGRGRGLGSKPAKGPELIPILRHNSACSRLTLSVHWDAESDKDSLASHLDSLDPVAMGAQDSYRAPMHRSLSMGSLVPAAYQAPFLPTASSAPSQSQPTLAGGVPPGLAQLSMAGGVSPNLTQPSVAAGGVPPRVAQSSVPSGGASPSVGQSSVGGGVAPSLGQPSMIGGVSSAPAQVSATSGVPPTLIYQYGASEVDPSLMATGATPRSRHPSMVSVGAHSQGHPSMASGMGPSGAQPSMASGVGPSGAQPSMASGVGPSGTHPSMASGVAPSGTHPSMASGVGPILTQPSMASGVGPSRTHPSMASGVGPILTQPSMASGVGQSIAQPSMASGVGPIPTHPSMASGVTSNMPQSSTTSGGTSSMPQSSTTSGGTSSLTESSMTRGVTSTLEQPSMASEMGPSGAQPSMASGVGPILTQPSMTSGVGPSTAQPSTASGVAPSIAQPSMASGVGPILTHPSMASGVGPNVAQPSMASGVGPNVAQPSMASGVGPNVAQPSMASGVGPNVAQPSMASGVHPYLAHPSMAGGVSSGPSRQSMVSGVTTLAQPSISSRMASNLDHSSMVIGVAPSPAQPSIASGLAPQSQPPPMASRVSQGVTQPSVASEFPPGVHQTSAMSRGAPGLDLPPMAPGVAPYAGQSAVVNETAPPFAQQSVATVGSFPIHTQSVTRDASSSLGYPPVAGGVGPSIAQPSMASGVSPSLARQSMASGVGPSIAQPSMASGVGPILTQPSMASGMGPSIAQPSMASGVGPILTQPSMASGMGPILTQPSMVSGVGPSGALASMASRVGPILTQPSMASGVGPSVAQSSMASGVAPSVAQPSMASGVGPILTQPSMASGVGPILTQPPMASGVGPSVAQPSMASGVGPILTHPSIASGVAPSVAQPSMASAISPGLVRHSMASGASPIMGQPSMTSWMAPSLAHSSLVLGVPPSFAQPHMGLGVMPSLAEPSVTSLTQTYSSSRVVSKPAHPSLINQGLPRLSQPAMDNLGPLGVAHPPMAARLTSSLSQPSVLNGMGRGLSQPGWISRVDPCLSPPRVKPTSVVISVSPGRQYPCVPGSGGTGHGLSQSPLGFEVDECREPLLMTGMLPHLQDAVAELEQVPLGFQQSPPICGRQSSMVTMSTPNLYHLSVTNENECCVAQMPTKRHRVPFRRMAAGPPQAPMGTPSMFLGVPQGAALADVPRRGVATSMGRKLSQVPEGRVPMAPQISEMATPLVVGESPPLESDLFQAAMVNQSSLSVSSVGPSVSQVNVALDPMTMAARPGYHYSSISPHDLLMAEAGADLGSGPGGSRVAMAMTPGSAASGVTLGLPSGSVIRGVGQGLPPSSLSASYSPDSTASVVAYGLPRSPVVSRAPPSVVPMPGASRTSQGLSGGPMTPVDSLGGRPLSSGAHSLPQASLLIGLSPRPYPGSLAGEGPHASSFQVSQANSLAPTPTAAPSVGRSLSRRIPTVLSLASQFGQDPELMTFGTIEEQSPAKAQGQYDDALSHVSGSSAESLHSEVLEATPWMYPGAQAVGGGVDKDRGPPLEQEAVKSQMVFREAAPSLAGMGGGGSPISYQSPSLARRPMASSGEPTTVPSMLAGSRAPPSGPLIVPSGLSGTTTRSAANRTRGQAQVPTMAEVPSTFQREPMAAASSMASRYPHQSVHGSTVTVTLPPGSMAKVGSPQLPPQGPTIPSAVSQVSPYGPSVRKLSSFQPGAGPRPTSGTSTPGSPSPLSPRKSYRSVPGSIVAELMDEATAKALPTLQEQKQPSQAPPGGGPKQAVGGTSTTSQGAGIVPNIYSGTATPSAPIPRLSPGVRRVSLGYESSPSGSRRPLLEDDSKEPLSSTPKYPKSSLVSAILQRRRSSQGSSGRARKSSTTPSAAVPGQASRGTPSATVPGQASRGTPSATVPGQASRGTPSATVPGQASRGTPSATVPGQASRGNPSSANTSWYARSSGTPSLPQPQASHNSTVHQLPQQHQQPPPPLTTPYAARGQAWHNFSNSAIQRQSTAPLTSSVLQGPMDAAGVAAGQSWNAAVPSVTASPMASRLAAATTNSGSDSHAVRGAWDAVGSEVATDPRQLGDLVVSVQTMERLIIHAVITIQACARGYLVRRTVRLWHQWATIIQATWRGYCVRRNLARLYQATTTIQAAWRGYCTRRQRAHQVLLPAVWAQMSARAMGHSKSITSSSSRGGLRSASEHRCFQSCQPHACNFCQSLSNPGLGNPPSVVMLVGSSPRTCHTCGHTLPTRVVHGMGRSVSTNQGTTAQWTYSGQLGPQSPRQTCGRARAATAIQSAWRGFRIRRQLREQQTAAKTLQASWRGRYTRNCLTTDALLGSGGPWGHRQNPNRSVSRTTQWPGV